MAVSGKRNRIFCQSDLCSCARSWIKVELVCGARVEALENVVALLALLVHKYIQAAYNPLAIRINTHCSVHKEILGGW